MQANNAPADPPQEIEKGREDESFDDENFDDEEDDRVVEKWHKIVNAVTSTTRKAFPSSPAFNPASPSAFQSYWNDIFSRLYHSTVSDSEIPFHLTSPPRKTFRINLFTAKHALDCPCCLPEVEPSILLENENGVTKEDFIKGLSAYLYGDSLPGIYGEEFGDEDSVNAESAEGESPEDGGTDVEEDCSKKQFGALVYEANWMSAGGEDGERFAYHADEPTIWMYCCEHAEFEEKTASDDNEKEKNVEGNQEEGTQDRTGNPVSKL